jgi:hypothetical protein
MQISQKRETAIQLRFSITANEKHLASMQYRKILWCSAGKSWPVAIPALSITDECSAATRRL